eukprot:TRINITY_DN8034_c0_g1_i4.p1 TRINITY_DN8034_c0_g1~~TRINITY_DN8034_c0_g1_i4.p1  ORF type:complete len:575 (-),score=79.61 TRINITY_DN8034_c0_g1_i4:214-1938(-)
MRIERRVSSSLVSSFTGNKGSLLPRKLNQGQKVENETTRELVRYLLDSKSLISQITNRYLNKNYKPVQFDKMLFRGCKIINTFVLTEFLSWSYPWIHTIDVSFTHVTDMDILQILPKCTNLSQLLLKGCKLTEVTLHHIGKYSTGLVLLGMWDAPFKVLELLPSTVKVSALDLSFCTNITNRLLTSLVGLYYLDISHIMTVSNKKFDKNSLIQMATHNPNLTALNLARAKHSSTSGPGGSSSGTGGPIGGSSGGGTSGGGVTGTGSTTGVGCSESSIFVLDDKTLSVILSLCPNLTHLNLAHVLIKDETWSETLNGLAKLTKLESLVLDGISNALQPSISSTISNMAKLSDLQVHLEHFGGKTTLGLFPMHNKFKRIHFQHPMFNDHFSKFIKVSANTLTEINFNGCGEITDEMGAALSMCKCLVSLELEGCVKLTQVSLNKIVSSCRRLLVVDFSGCNVTDLTMRILLVDSLQDNLKKSLHTILLSGCIYLTQKTLSYLQTQYFLRVLKLSRCDILNPDNLAELCTYLPHLKLLDVMKCPNLITSDDNEVATKRLLLNLVRLLPNTNIRLKQM